VLLGNSTNLIVAGFFAALGAPPLGIVILLVGREVFNLNSDFKKSSEERRTGNLRIQAHTLGQRQE
jgi:hypothetical protein